MDIIIGAQEELEMLVSCYVNLISQQCGGEENAPFLLETNALLRKFLEEYTMFLGRTGLKEKRMYRVNFSICGRDLVELQLATSRREAMFLVLDRQSSRVPICLTRIEEVEPEEWQGSKT